jgi:hypothetical protein
VTPAPGLRPFFPYYGGKFRSAPRYPAPLHDWIIEPFAGSAGYAMRYPDRQVVLVEASEPIAAIWQYLTLATPREILRLPLLEPGQSVDSLVGVPQAARWLIGMWCSPGSAAPKKTLGRWDRSDGAHVQYQFWGRAVRERIASQLPRIAHWIVKHGAHTSAPSVEATWFIDPPYQTQGRHYPCGSADIDYPALAGWCRRRRGQVMVCENTGARWLPFQHFIIAKANAAKGRAGVSHEALWTPALG